MKIAVVEGDGIGHEVIPVARQVIETLRPDLEFYPVEIGYGRWERTGSAISDDEITDLRAADAVLFGAITTPPAPEYRSCVVAIRKALDLYANVRPVKGDGFDIIIVRENTEGLYAGIEKIENDCATSLRVLTRTGCERIARYSCSLAKGRRFLTIGHKANVLKADILFRDIARGEADMVGVPWNERFIDALCLDVLMHPAAYDVIVTENMFGDILSDVSAYLVGGLGMLPSANIGERNALFEPVHGSAPDIAGKNLANPVAAVRSAAMLLDYIGDPDSGKRVNLTMDALLREDIRTRDLGGKYGTREFGEALLKRLADGKK
ncbi:MAG: isocitrate/isopropylmalate dehydrogenase family protein [Methanoregulaceae archaeon]